MTNEHDSSPLRGTTLSGTFLLKPSAVQAMVVDALHAHGIEVDADQVSLDFVKIRAEIPYTVEFDTSQARILAQESAATLQAMGVPKAGEEMTGERLEQEVRKARKALDEHGLDAATAAILGTEDDLGPSYIGPPTTIRG